MLYDVVALDCAGLRYRADDTAGVSKAGAQAVVRFSLVMSADVKCAGNDRQLMLCRQKDNLIQTNTRLC